MVILLIADTIKQMRQMANLTQSDLAKKLNITRSSVNAWEMGISVPSTQYVVELAHVFKVSTDYILGVESENTISLDELTQEQLKIIYGLIQYFKGEGKE